MAKRINLGNASVARSNTIRDINRQIVLNYIREQGPISRADIAKATEMQRSTISLIVNELLESNLIEEIYGESSGGRPPLLLSLRTSQAVVIGIELGMNRTMVATADLGGKQLDRIEFPTDADFEVTTGRMIEAANALIAQNGGSIEGIGISVPGMVRSVDGEVLLIPHLDWRRPKLAEVISSATGLPVKVENDANAAALAELWFGRPEINQVRDFILVYITNGIGTGVVFDGQIYRGKDGVAGEFGHMHIGEGAPIECAAGSRGCWEAFASERSALARYRNLKGEKNGSRRLLFSELIDLALDGDEHAVHALRETARYIGIGISNLTQGLSPEATVVAGRIVRAWALVADAIKAEAERGICLQYPSVNVMPSSLGPHPTLKGAFSLILAEKFASVSIA